MVKITTVALAALLTLSACVMPSMHHMSSPQDGDVSSNNNGMGKGMVQQMAPQMGRGHDMMRFHHAEIPEEYAGLSSPIAPDDDSLARGLEAYQANCTICHGDGGMGDGPAGKALDPAPAPIAHTSQMLGDDYLFWRISEGGTHFTTAMPAWEAALDEQIR